MFKGLLDNYRWQAHVRMCAKRGDLKVVFEKGLPQPRTNKDTMFLPLPSQMTTDFDRTKLLHFANHESSHHEYSTDFDLIGEETGIIPATNFLGAIWNAFEDNRVDLSANKEWFGVKENSDDFYEGFLPELLEKHKELQADPSFPQKFKDTRSSLIYIALANQAEHTPAIRVKLDEFRALLSEKANEYIDRYLEGDYQERIYNAPAGLEGSRSMADLAREVERVVYKDDEEEEEESDEEGDGGGDSESSQGDPSEESNSSSGDGDSGESDGDDNEEGEQEEEQEGDSDENNENDEGDGGEKEEEGEKGDEEEGEGTGDNDEESNNEQEEEKGEGEQESEGDSEPTEEALIKQYEEEYPNANLQQGSHGAGDGSSNEEEVEYSEYQKGEYKTNLSSQIFQPHPLDQLEVVNYENKTSKNCAYGRPLFTYMYHPERTERKVASIERLSDGKKLSTILRKLLQIHSRKRWSYGKKKGKLDGKNLHRLMIPDGGNYSQRVFKQKGESLTIDSAVQLVVDFSGSMEGEKMATAIVSADLLCETISRGLRVPVELLGFSGSPTTRMAVFKTFDVPVGSEELKRRMIEGTHMCSYNADGEALSWAYQRLIRRKEKRKVMIVLSDGMPALDDDYRVGNIFDYTKKVIKEIEEQSPVDIIGIGFMDDTVKYLYKHNVIINKASELEDALLTIIKSRILTGEKR